MRIPQQQNVTPMPPVKPVKVNKYPDIEYLSKCARTVGALIKEEELKKGAVYEPPITLYMNEIQTQIEDNCVKAVQNYGFNIDKEELIKALEYDRNQYDKGYAAARERYERPRGNWNPYDGNSYTEGFRLMCSKCGFIHTFIDHHTAQYRFCPNCGADMRKEPENE